MVMLDPGRTFHLILPCLVVHLSLASFISASVSVWLNIDEYCSGLAFSENAFFYKKHAD
jgi:hypothetical protein